MVLGFGRSTKKRGKGDDKPAIRPSPSLPQMSAQGVAWPENLVDVAEVKGTTAYPAQGAAKTSFSSTTHSAIPFHKPFRMATYPNANGGPISSLYMSVPPSAFGNQAVTSYPAKLSRTSSRRSRVAPTFNLMVAGAQGTGKTSLLRLLVDTADISSLASSEQQAAMDHFLRGPPKRTEHLKTASIEISESRFDRILLTVIDTPGLDFSEGRELKLERQVSSLVKYIDRQYAETMGEEFKVVRKSKGDQHVHLCIYMVDPDSVLTPTQRRAKSSLPRKTRSEVTISSIAHKAPSLADEPPEDADDEPDPVHDRPTMSPADIRVIRRLSTRVNVLPVVARSDSLTDEKLDAIKAAIQRDLHVAGLGFGIFGHGKVHDNNKNAAGVPHVNGNSHGNGNGEIDEGIGSDDEDEDEDEEDEGNGGGGGGDRRSRTVIKLRPNSRISHRSNSRSRIDLSESASDQSVPLPLDATDPESVASTRFSAHVIAQRAPLEDLLPFALIAPEPAHSRRPPVDHRESRYSMDTYAASDNGMMAMAGPLSPDVRSALSVHTMPYWQGPPKDLKGVFLRRFRWGTVDVLDPSHCDFAALRTAVLSTHMRVLKSHTKNVLYEKFRTEKLLARRATQNISEEARRRLLEDLGL
ncbi:hypothetical protein BD410DRAFT_747416 [Rickenella mellea]|uniref:Septin-type G domain-containing protein n=1 Tax=Rickenella mellea TaxID=50990 RepID=A0A4Y7Q7Z1_9AGAM|nr:hypothetical protein BD410DRAFT_747416 [Rickenella mellea]